MAKEFSAQVDDFIRKSKARMIAVAKGSIQTTINNAQIPVAKGGRMRVDTGFLRASGRISFSGLPSGPSRPPTGSEPNSFNWVGDGALASLAGMKLGDTIYFGWTAEYAQYREMYDGFLGTQLQNWQKTVDAEVRKAKAAIR